MFISASLKWNIPQNNYNMKNETILIVTEWSLIIDTIDWKEWFYVTYV